jgi:hypothetical protein
MLLLITPVKVREDDIGGPTRRFDGKLECRDHQWGDSWRTGCGVTRCVGRGAAEGDDPQLAALEFDDDRPQGFFQIPSQANGPDPVTVHARDAIDGAAIPKVTDVVIAQDSDVETPQGGAA